jgi:hypothetical protein
MALYRALQDISPGGNWPHIEAGTVFSDVPPNNSVPPGYVPPGAVDPLDADAQAKFFGAGVQLLGKIAAGVAPPAVYWKRLSGNTYQLTGDGASLGTAQLWVRGTVP